jgi:hypothetical protein
MNQQLIRYTTRPEHAGRNEELIHAVYAELHQTQPGGLRYATFKLSDGVTFLHLVQNEHGDKPSALLAVKAFGEFQEGLAERRADGPSRDELIPIGSYRVFGAHEAGTSVSWCA